MGAKLLGLLGSVGENAARDIYEGLRKVDKSGVTVRVWEERFTRNSSDEAEKKLKTKDSRKNSSKGGKGKNTKRRLK